MFVFFLTKSYYFLATNFCNLQLVIKNFIVRNPLTDYYVLTVMKILAMINFIKKYMYKKISIFAITFLHG